MLDVRRMRVLREVAIRGSFSAAAEALSFTQSAVSQQIAALEREAGTTLVQRSARGVRLTEAGEAVVRHAEAIMARLAEAEAELEAIAGLRGGRLRMASFESAGSTLMPLAIAALPRAPSRRRAVDEPVRARGLHPAAAQRRARPRDRLRVGGREHRRRHPPRPPARGPDVPRAPARPPARQPPPDPPRRPRRRGVGGGAGRLRVQPADRRAPARRTASLRGSRSRPTTTRRCRASSPPASASR